jgi:hypothetical protein
MSASPTWVVVSVEKNRLRPRQALTTSSRPGSKMGRASEFQASMRACLFCREKGRESERHEGVCVSRFFQGAARRVRVVSPVRRALSLSISLCPHFSLSHLVDVDDGDLDVRALEGDHGHGRACEERKEGERE